MLEHLCTDEDGEAHDSSHQGVESWEGKEQTFKPGSACEEGAELRPTVGDQGSTRQDFPQQELHHSQGDADEAADDRDAEQEVVLTGNTLDKPWVLSLRPRNQTVTGFIFQVIFWKRNRTSA